MFSLHEIVLLMWVGSFSVELRTALYWTLFGSVFAVISTGVLSCVLKGVGQIRPELCYIGIGFVVNLALKYWLIDFHALGSLIASACSWAFSSLIFVWLATRSEAISRRALLISVVCAITFLLLLTAIGWFLDRPSAETQSEATPALLRGVVAATVATSVYVVICNLARRQWSSP
jgi:Na+-driven multidrug efflux pump